LRTFTKSEVVEFLKSKCGYGKESSELMADLVFKARRLGGGRRETSFFLTPKSQRGRGPDKKKRKPRRASATLWPKVSFNEYARRLAIPYEDREKAKVWFDKKRAKGKI